MTLVIVKKDLNNFFGPKTIVITWMKNSKLPKKMTTKTWTGAKSNNERGKMQSVHATEESDDHCSKSFGGKEISSSVLISTSSKDMLEQLKLAEKEVDVVNRAIKEMCVTILQYKVDKPQSSFAQVLLFARMKEDAILQQIVCVKHKFEKLINLFGYKKFSYLFFGNFFHKTRL